MFMLKEFTALAGNITGTQPNKKTTQITLDKIAKEGFRKRGKNGNN